MNFKDASLEFLKLVIKMCETFTQKVLHLCIQYLYLSIGNAVFFSEIYRVLY